MQIKKYHNPAVNMLCRQTWLRHINHWLVSRVPSCNWVCGNKQLLKRAQRDRMHELCRFHTPTIVKVLRMVGLSLLPLIFLQKNAKSLTPLLEVGESEIGPKGGLVKLDRDGSRKIEYITIPYSNHSQNIEDGWLVSSSTGVPTNNAKSLTPLLQFGVWAVKWRLRVIGGDRCRKIVFHTQTKS